MERDGRDDPMGRSISPATPGSRRCTFTVSPAAHARLAAVAAREGRTVANVVQCLVLHALHLADLPIASLELVRRAPGRRRVAAAARSGRGQHR
jgi:hypothetical protein